MRLDQVCARLFRCGAGNIAVDAEGGGRLIYYDFGMMGRIPSDVRGGLLELFYGEGALALTPVRNYEVLRERRTH